MTRDPQPLSVLMAYSSRPEAIKMAPVVCSLKNSRALHPKVVVSGQPHGMLDHVNQLFGITPDVRLDIVEPGQSPAQAMARALETYSEFLTVNPVDAVIVQGDSTTAFAAALAAFHAQVPVAHVEAGLRTGQRSASFPEEINRKLLAQTASLHLAPTETSRANLLSEGVAAEDVVVTGNTVIDALLHAVTQQQVTGDPVIDEACRSRRPIVLVTTRREDPPGYEMAAVAQAVTGIARARPDVLVVFPVHMSPPVPDQLLSRFDALENVRLIEPLPYERFCYVLGRSTLVVTDSGGIQEEAPSLGVPVLVMRDTTERPEALQAGAAKLVGTGIEEIEGNVLDLLYEDRLYRAMAVTRNPFGDGRAAARTRAAVEALLGVGQRMPDFKPSRIKRRVGGPGASRRLDVVHPVNSGVAL